MAERDLGPRLDPLRNLHRLPHGVEAPHDVVFDLGQGVAAQQHVYDSLGLSSDVNIVIHFSKKRAVDPDTFDKYPTPSLKGVSGGGIFAWPKGEELSDDWNLPKLIGLIHSFREKDGLIIGSTLLPVIAAIQLGRMKKFGGVR